MPIVSSVIHNRLKKGMRLQMDGTLNYGKYSHIKVTPKRIREDNTTYNTYLHKGIPLFPVCNVSDNAILAAIFPATTKYLYFMKSSKGTHDFSCNYSTHLKYIKHATKWNIYLIKKHSLVKWLTYCYLNDIISFVNFMEFLLIMKENIN